LAWIDIFSWLIGLLLPNLGSQAAVSFGLPGILDLFCDLQGHGNYQKKVSIDRHLLGGCFFVQCQQDGAKDKRNQSQSSHDPAV